MIRHFNRLIKAAVAITGLLEMVKGLWIIAWIAGWLQVLPMQLFKAIREWQTLKTGEQRVAARRLTIATWLVVCIGVFVLLSMPV